MKWYWWLLIAVGAVLLGCLVWRMTKAKEDKKGREVGDKIDLDIVQPEDAQEAPTEAEVGPTRPEGK